MTPLPCKCSSLYLKVFLVVVIGFKLVLMGMFSSDYQEKMFLPFVSCFVTDHQNPYQYFFQNTSVNPFPYPPLMLLIESAFGFIVPAPCGFIRIPDIISMSRVHHTINQRFPVYVGFSAAASADCRPGTNDIVQLVFTDADGPRDSTVSIVPMIGPDFCDQHRIRVFSERSAGIVFRSVLHRTDVEV